MTLHALYIRAAVAKRALDRIHARITALSQILVRGPVRRNRRIHYTVRRAMRVSRVRHHIAAVARNEARDRLLFDPWEHEQADAILRRFAETVRKVSS